MKIRDEYDHLVSHGIIKKSDYTWKFFKDSALRVYDIGYEIGELKTKQAYEPEKYIEPKHLKYNPIRAEHTSSVKQNKIYDLENS